MIAMAMTVYDGFASLILQPIVGAIFSVIVTVFVLIVASPLLLPKIWPLWRRIWLIPLLLVPVSWLLMILSWYPYRITVYDDVLMTDVQSFQPELVITGYLLLLFAILYQPKIAISKSKRWW
ncbi:hypothetical protein [Poriferisphaera sp. WC338]|uniref:hypothetical protein n=1 Tax=Poriferisphaera sp. WC338 TaxID=3425129 RepID=UPI003D812BC3